MRVLARTAASARLQATHFARDVIAGLTAERKTLPAKYFYDDRGSALFEAITGMPEYYPTRTELGILEARAAEIGALMPTGAALIELGSGSTAKARILLRRRAIAAYVPVDISAGFLKREVAQLRHDLPWLRIVPVAADFTKPFELPAEVRARPHVGFFPGSTIGNFEPGDAAEFLRHAGRLLGYGAQLIVGVDLVKDPAVLNAAYNDAAGVTAAFNLNLLRRINRELGADFDLDGFRHTAFFSRAERRIEMHLVSRDAQQVHLADRTIAFRRGETIHTENSYKYTVESFQALAAAAGWSPVAVWTDAQRYFSVHALRVSHA
ncbi:MAG: L-histidine N(alpha)-methyltransferase [Acetobacteraceae bacterium]|nr:L-histidine N(alpha)-methyltransferase [Acetobacteraceae bacterium]